VPFCEAAGDRSQHEVRVTPDLTETLMHQVGSDIRTKFGEQVQGLMNVGMSAGGRDRPLASLGDDDFRQSAGVFIQNACRQRGCEHQPTDCLRILAPARSL